MIEPDTGVIPYTVKRRGAPCKRKKAREARGSHEDCLT